MHNSIRMTQPERELLGLACGFPSTPVRVMCETEEERIEGPIVRGTVDPRTGKWELDDTFTIIDHTDGQPFVVHGYAGVVTVI
ncbi:hypothetical protein [Nitrospirillum amazonense]|uniref:hypothetical protein n=1 Tax=Nitrospirillum amazonense TaxID=28077 RepID=UPI002412D454|nr:hypothetical protein [Nitrospirillum amazonense]MDG3443720.1 hypothetical protein [Nitrospirillum amazonense]